MCAMKHVKIFGKEVEMECQTDADLSVFEEVFVDLGYKILDEAIVGASTIVDIGGHIGCFAVYAGGLNAGAQIFVYEPVKRNFDLIKSNSKRNHIRNVTVKNLAVAEEEGQRLLKLSADSHNHSLIEVKEEIGEEIVNTTTLSAILRKIGMTDVVKIDCEGAEFEILKSMDSVDFMSVKTFFIEYHEGEGRNKNLLIEILKQNNFKVRDFPSHYDKTMGFVFALK
jgi:FkbM family methyltransferase